MYSLCSWPKESLYISRDGKPSFALLSTLRLWATPPSKRRSVKHIVFSGNRFSRENEVAAMGWITAKCRELLTSCLTSIDEDALMLRTIGKFEDYAQEAETRAEFYDEVRTLLGSDDLIMCGGLCEKLRVYANTRRSICRLRLAVQWRYNYKTILSDCISQCTRMLDYPCC